MTTITLIVPGRVYYDFLDPLASGMAEEIGLPDISIVKRGKGWSARYDGVTLDQAEWVAAYLYDRGETLLAQRIDDPYDPEEKAARDTLRAGIKTAEKIREQVRRERAMRAVIDAPVVR